MSDWEYPGREDGIVRLRRVWPWIMETRWAERSDVAADLSREGGAVEDFLDEISTTRYHMGVPDNRDHVALALIVQAGESLCGMDHQATLRLLREAMNEVYRRIPAEPVAPTFSSPSVPPWSHG